MGYNEHSIANENSCNGNKINFFQKVNDQYLFSKKANSLLFISFYQNSNFSVLCLNIRSLSNLKNFVLAPFNHLYKFQRLMLF